MKRLLPVLALLSGVAVAVPSDYLSVKKPGTVKVKQGTSAEAVIELDIKTGFHIQANPASTPQLIPTKVDFTAPTGVEIGPAVYPPGKSYRLATSQSDISTYDGKVTIKVPLKVAADAKVGKIDVEGKLRFQPCNDKLCFFPNTETLVLPIKITQ